LQTVFTIGIYENNGLRVRLQEKAGDSGGGTGIVNVRSRGMEKSSGQGHLLNIKNRRRHVQNLGST
jgi:hypothetical protein